MNSFKELKDSGYVDCMLKIMELQTRVELERIKFEYTAAFHYKEFESPVARAHFKASTLKRYQKLENEMKDGVEKINKIMA